MKATTLLVGFSVLALASGLRADPDSDRRLESAIRSTYIYRSLFADRVQVQALDGAVTLVGAVPSPELKLLAADTAARVAGVASVDNALAVNPPAKGSAAWIEDEVRLALLLRDDVSAAETHVAVHNGTVTLTGNAGTLVQKSLAGVYAKEVDGVKSVDNRIVAADRSSLNAPLDETVDDASVAALVKFVLRTHESTDDLPVKVTAKHGAVTITGQTRWPMLKDFVPMLVRDVRGVASIHNNITTPPRAG